MMEATRASDLFVSHSPLFDRERSAPSTTRPKKMKGRTASKSLASSCFVLLAVDMMASPWQNRQRRAARRRLPAAALCLMLLLLLLLALAQVVQAGRGRPHGVRACFVVVANDRACVPVGRRRTNPRTRTSCVQPHPPLSGGGLREGRGRRRGMRLTPPTARHLGKDHHDVSGSSSSSSEEDPFVADENDDDATSWKRRAEELREQIRRMERQLEEDRASSRTSPNPNPVSGGKGGNDNNNNNRREYEWMGRRPSSSGDAEPGTKDEAGDGFTLRNRRVLVAGANGRLGSMVCRYLLRNHPTTQVVAAVHVVGENSPTARGYGRLGYEVGAEDGIGTIGAAWSGDQRTATYQYDAESMQGYNLQNLRVVECELLDPVQCRSVVDGCDAVIWCATDFNRNVPRSVSSLNVALLFRAVSRPTKGRVDVEGVQNMLGAIKQELQERKRRRKDTNGPLSSSSIVNFVLVSTSPDAYDDYETPFGSFRGIKKQGEEMMRQFPSLSTTVLQMARFEDNFVGEDLEIQMEEVTPKDGGADELGATAGAAATTSRRKINRRDAAKAAVESLQNEGLVGKTVQVWTAT